MGRKKHIMDNQQQERPTESDQSSTSKPLLSFKNDDNNVTLQISYNHNDNIPKSIEFETDYLCANTNHQRTLPIIKHAALNNSITNRISPSSIKKRRLYGEEEVYTQLEEEDDQTHHTRNQSKNKIPETDQKEQHMYCTECNFRPMCANSEYGSFCVQAVMRYCDNTDNPCLFVAEEKFREAYDWILKADIYFKVDIFDCRREHHDLPQCMKVRSLKEAMTIAKGCEARKKYSIHYKCNVAEIAKKSECNEYNS